MRKLRVSELIVSGLAVFFGILVSNFLWAAYSDLVLELLIEGRILLIILVLLFGVVSYLGYLLIFDGGGWEYFVPEFSASERVEQIGLYIMILTGTIVWLILFNLLSLMVGVLMFEMVGVGHTHADRLNLVTDLLALLYGVIAFALLFWLPYYIYRNWSAKVDQEE